jgi:hypothetical protein
MAHPIEAYELAAQWDRLFQERYLALEGQPRTKTDVDKILEELKSKVDPVEYAKDKAIDSAVKKWFKRLAPMMAFLSSAPAVAVRVFLEPSEIMNPLSELQQKNREVRDAVWKVTSTMLYADAKTRYTNMLMQLPAPTGPQIKRP